ncbi:hypothetical protein DENSPDRAFT_887437, partial [Dentipellis sp. KUC8613]
MCTLELGSWCVRSPAVPRPFGTALNPRAATLFAPWAVLHSTPPSSCRTARCQSRRVLFASHLAVSDPPAPRPSACRALFLAHGTISRPASPLLRPISPSVHPHAVCMPHYAVFMRRPDVCVPFRRLRDAPRALNTPPHPTRAPWRRRSRAPLR